MLDIMNFENYWEKGSAWFETNVWNINILYEFIILLCAFVIGSVVHRLLKGNISKRIEDAKLPSTARRVANNLTRLLLHVITLLVLFVATNIVSIEAIGMNVALLVGVMKVLMAWVVIRIAVQFIANSAVRNFFSLIIWTIAALSILGVLDSTTEALDSVAFSIGEFRLSALVVIKGLLSIFILLYLALFTSSFAERRVLKVKGLTRSSQVLIAKIIRVCLIVMALFIGITSAGIDLSLFAVFGGAIGLGIGFGLQKGISNLFSGMLLLMDQSIKPGDVIEIPDIGTFGWVNHMAARYTEIVTRDNKSFLIPNEDFITQRVVNWSHGNSLIRIAVDFGVHYDSDPHEVIELATEAAKTPERVVDSPSPVCWITEFADSSVNFTLRFWIKDAESGVTNVKGEVLLALWDAFKENDISIPYPHREVYVHEVKAEKPKPKKKKPAPKTEQSEPETPPGLTPKKAG